MTSPVNQGRMGLLLASSTDGAVGDGRDLLWHLPEDLQRFKSLTMGCTCLLGRRTLESIGRVLTGRRFVVLTRQRPTPDSPLFTSYPGVIWATGVEEALEATADDDPLWVIGGADVYQALEERADWIDRTEVEGTWPEAPARFTINPMLWHCDQNGEWQESRSGLRYRYQRYLRIRP